jgi:hypothetical protein
VLGIKSLAERFAIASGVVLVQHLGWGVTMPIGTMGGALHPHRDITARDRFLGSFKRDLFPLRIGANQVAKAVQTGWLLPNPHAGFATVETLANGQPMLFRTTEAQVWHGARPPFDAWAVPRIRDNVAFFRWLSDELLPAGLRLAVLLVPQKYTAYQPFLKSTAVSARSIDPYLPLMAGALRVEGIVTIDLSEPFHGAAERALATDDPIYWPDDTQWSPAGVEVAAAESARVLTEHGLLARHR